jgi:hypothetical protein
MKIYGSILLATANLFILSSCAVFGANRGDVDPIKIYAYSIEGKICAANDSWCLSQKFPAFIRAKAQEVLDGKDPKTEQLWCTSADDFRKILEACPSTF